MTAHPLVWFAVAAVLGATGLGLLTLARRSIAVKTPEGAQEPRTHLPEGGCAGPPIGNLFEPHTAPRRVGDRP